MTVTTIPHLIQYQMLGQHHTTVLCWDHETRLLDHLRQLGVGCVATTAPGFSRCDQCESERLRTMDAFARVGGTG